ncbi:MAG: tRNA (adenosine(37)-N6)-threonylcarbamoyltransferase complex ATPase subunit type 1 TsaE [Acidobacteriia bacterium]|nr:tRNA (adenosine(37)-N6)-threonylcarbamoyltransferase complex ATPase subunit type 1 TsaE [Terriglobia bacterium]
MPLEFERETRSAEETIAFGAELAAQLRPPVLVLLFGELGAGKTTLAKGIISGLGVARLEDVTSPTFTLVHAFGNHPRVYHVDLYRISGQAELESIGLDDLLAEPAVILVEWAEKLTLRTDWPVIEIRLEAPAADDRRRLYIRDRAGVLHVEARPGTFEQEKKR